MRSTAYRWVAAIPLSLAFGASLLAQDVSISSKMRVADRGYGALRTIDPVSGEQMWERRHPAPSRAGALSTAGGVVFSGDNEGGVFAADSRTGKEPWRYPVGSPLYAAPSTYAYMIGARQYVIVPAGTMLAAFALPQR